jgi:hypothetical protein
MKITRKRLTEIIKEEIYNEAEADSPRGRACQGIEPDTTELSQALSDLRAARDTVARAYPELLDELDYVITKLKGATMPPSPAIQPYTMYEDDEV